MIVQSMSRSQANRELRHRSHPIYRFHLTEPDLLIVSYVYDGKVRHTLLERGMEAFREIQLVNGRRCPLANRFLNAQELEEFVQELVDSEDPKELCS
jgi:hypothetical protein